MKYENTFIIGGGVTGLSTAWKLASRGVPVTIIEQDLIPGGLAATLDWGGWKFDYGPHNFHTNDQAIIQHYLNLMGNDFVQRNPNVRLYIYGKFVSYPLVGIDALLSMSGPLMIRASLDFFMSRVRTLFYGLPHTEHLDEWILMRFGTTLYKTYFGPYIERVWKRKPHDLSKKIGELKIPTLSVRNYFQREILKRTHYNKASDLSQWDMYYPKGGIGAIAECYVRLLSAMPHVTLRLGEEVQAIHIQNGHAVRVETNKGDYETKNSYVVSSMPLGKLVEEMPELPKDIRTKVHNLEYCSERFLFLKVNKPKVSGFDWCYFSEDRFPFNRVSETGCNQFGMAPEGKCGLTFEFPCNNGDWAWNATKHELVDTVLKLYGPLFGLQEKDIIDSRSEYQHYAYPRYLVKYEDTLKEAFQHIDRIENLLTTGRQGMFCYVNVDMATKLGFETADAILNHKNSAIKHEDLLKRYHGITLNP